MSVSRNMTIRPNTWLGKLKANRLMNLKQAYIDISLSNRLTYQCELLHQDNIDASFLNRLTRVLAFPKE